MLLQMKLDQRLKLMLGHWLPIDQFRLTMLKSPQALLAFDFSLNRYRLLIGLSHLQVEQHRQSMLVIDLSLIQCRLLIDLNLLQVGQFHQSMLVIDPSLIQCRLLIDLNHLQVGQCRLSMLVLVNLIDSNRHSTHWPRC